MSALGLIDSFLVYLSAIIYPRDSATTVAHGPAWRYIIIPALVFLVVSYVTNYALLASNVLLGQMIDTVVEHARTDEDREAALEARESVETAMGVPGMKALVTLRAVFVSFISVMMFLFMFAAITSFLVEREGSFKIIGTLSSLFTGILCFGMLVNCALKLICRDHRMAMGITAVIRPGERESIGVLEHVDLFVLWYGIALSVACSSLFKERIWTYIVLFLSCQALMLLASHLANFPFSLM